jgi:hypothetical protein
MGHDDGHRHCERVRGHEGVIEIAAGSPQCLINGSVLLFQRPHEPVAGAEIDGLLPHHGCGFETGLAQAQ